MADIEEEETPLIIRFVLPRNKSETTCTEDLSYAFDQAQDHDMNPTWIKDETCTSLTPAKTDVFVVDPFEGEGFEYLAKFKCTLIGPRCLLTCLIKNQPVPNLPYPMYTVAMEGMVVTSTGLQGKDDKKELQMKIERMGGVYSNNFHDGVTHLVAKHVRSPKYDVAVKKEIPIMTDEWVTQVWEKGMHQNIHATDPTFTRYKCPALMGLTLTVSQMGRKDKELLKKSIENHGGTYTGQLDMEQTQILIISKPEGDKYKYAKKWKIPCISSDWVFDSIEKGYCLHTEGYRVDQGRAGSTSTPTKDTSKVPGLQEVSMCSTILEAPDETLTKKVNETVMNNTTINQSRMNNTTLLAAPSIIKNDMHSNSTWSKAMGPPPLPTTSKSPAISLSKNSIDNEATIITVENTEDDIITQYKVDKRDNNEKMDFKTPTASKRTSASSVETPVISRHDIEKCKPRPMNITLTPSADEASPWRMPPESQPSPITLKRKRDEDTHHVTPFILRNVKTPETPYGAFLGKNPSKDTRKFWKLQFEEMGRFEMSEEEKTELMAKKQRITSYAKECHDEREKCKMESEYNEYFKNALDPQKTKEMHVKTFQRCGVPLLEPGGKSFDELMEEKMQKQGRSWKKPKYLGVDRIPMTTEKQNCQEDSFKQSELSAQLAKFDEIAQMNNTKDDSINGTLKDKSFDENGTSKRRTSMRMTLSSIEDDNTRNIEAGLETRKNKSIVSNLDSQIRWVNPKEEEERKKLAAKLEAETQDLQAEDNINGPKTFDTMDLPENLTEHLDGDNHCDQVSKSEAMTNHDTLEEDKNNTNDIEIPEKTVYRKFMTSGIGAEEQKEFAQFLEGIGIEFVESSTCEPNATHVIAQKIARSEKMLGSIASGKWLLHPSYMVDCIECGKLLDEVDYEWGNANNDLINDLSTDLEKKLAKASYRLRVKREKGQESVFSGIKAIIHTSEQRKASFKKLLELGGGKVIDSTQKVKPPYSDPKDATHCIAEPNKLPKQSIDYEALAMKGVAVVNPVYINEFLANDPPPSAENHLIEDFKQYWNKRKF